MVFSRQRTPMCDRAFKEVFPLKPVQKGEAASVLKALAHLKSLPSPSTHQGAGKNKERER